MSRQDHYSDSGMNQMIAAQMQHAQAQRPPQNAGIGHYPGRADEESQYMSSKAGGQWQWNRDGPKASHAISPHMYHEGQRPDGKPGLEKQAVKDPRAPSHEADMEVGYEDTVALPQTFESLEQKFIQDIIELTKELEDAEDKENARHRERLMEINTKYQEKLVAMRARQANKREEVLRIESQARHNEYQKKQQQQAHMVGYQSNVRPPEPHGYGPPGGPISRGYGAASGSEFESAYGDQARDRGYQQPRGPYPGGRAYNSDGRYF